DKPVPKDSVEVQPVEEKSPSLLTRVKKELLHYYHGFRLLGLEIKIASGLCFQMLRGHTLTRRERNQLVRTVADIFRLVPFAVFIVVPFMEFLLPVYIKLFPFMMPSTFKEKKTEEEKIKLRLMAKLKMAKFLQDTISQTSTLTPSEKLPENTPTLGEFSKFLHEIRSTGDMPNISDIVKFSRLFEDQVTLDSLDSKNLKALCQLLDINTMGPANLLRIKLYMRVRQLKAEDQLISNEGVDQIPGFELQSLCRERGMRSLGLSEDRLRKQLSQWLELQLVHQVPIALLLLSRAMYMHDATPAERLQKAISSLPESVQDVAQINILNQQVDEVDTKTKIDLLKREQETIKKERAETRKQEKKEAPYVPSATFLGPEMQELRPEEMMNQLSGSLSKPLNELEAEIKNILDTSDKQEPSISLEDLGTISQAISELEVSKQDLHKEEVEEMKEDLKLAAETQKALVMAEENTEMAKKNKGAKQLAARVDRMLEEMTKLLNGLSEEKSSLKKDIEMHQVMVKHEQESSNKMHIEKTIAADQSRMIEVNELMLALRKIQKVPDDTKWQRILQVLDEDNDGHIELKHVYSVIELMGAENMKLDRKEVARILNMLDSEEQVNKTNLDKAP
ncbi:letm1 and EF-hand domain-containing protein 1, mitochondrial, partial [Cichlidogyrus casuarinus]